jgi:hypothetical protein
MTELLKTMVNFENGQKFRNKYPKVRPVHTPILEHCRNLTKYLVFCQLRGDNYVFMPYVARSTNRWLLIQELSDRNRGNQRETYSPATDSDTLIEIVIQIYKEC